MRKSFSPRLVNPPQGDPGVFIPFTLEKRAILFDMGDIYSLSPKDVLKITHIFISHTHMDHFSGFDHMLRLLLGRDKKICIYGPKGIIKNVDGKLKGYSWNLVEGYKESLILSVTEVCKEKLTMINFRCKDRFIPKNPPEIRPFSDILLDEPDFEVSTAILDHGIPCLGFALKEKFHVNIKKDMLIRMGFSTGPWLAEFKRAILEGVSSDFRFSVPVSLGKNVRFRLGELKKEIAFITAGEKITYITDVIFSPLNQKKIISLAKDSTHLFIEACFLENEKDMAFNKFHLTAKEAGFLAGKANARQFTLFHFSPRYTGMEEKFYKEAQKAYEDAVK